MLLLVDCEALAQSFFMGSNQRVMILFLPSSEKV